MKDTDLDDSSADQTPLNDTEAPSSSTRIPWFSHLIASPILFPAIIIFVLAAIWGTTLSLIKIERTAAEQKAAALSHELARDL